MVSQGARRQKRSAGKLHIGRRWSIMTAAVVVIAAFSLLPSSYAMYTGRTSITGNSVAAAVTFPVYSTRVQTDTPWAYHRGEDTVSAAATSVAADTPSNARPGTYVGTTNGPRLWWTFGEGAGTRTDDLSGCVNMGTVNTGATWTTGPGGTGAVTATGTSTTVYSDQQPIRADQSFTISVWAYMTGSTANTRAVASITGAPGGTVNPRSDWTLMFDPNGGVPRWSFLMAEDPTSGANLNYDYVLSTSTPVQNTWTHLVAVYNTAVAGGTMYLYVNGVQEASTTHTPLHNTTSGASLDLGRRRNTAFGSFWNGSFGETRAYQRALSSTEVANLHNSLPEIRWNFSESSGSTTADSGVNGNTGTLGSATSFTAGRVGNGVTMNNSANGYVDGSRKATETDRSFSVAAWVNLNSTGASASRAIVTQSGTTSSSFILKLDSSNKWAFGIPQDDVATPAIDQVLSTGAAGNNSWVHLAGVYDDAANTVRLYVNGTSQGTTAHTDANEWNANGKLEVGRVWWNGVWTDKWYGSVDSVRVYQRALSGAEVTGLAADTDPNPPFTDAGMSASITGALQGVQQGQQAALAVGFSGLGNAYNNLQVAVPGPTAFTIECWFRMSTLSGGGVLIGFGSATSGISASADRLLYLDSGNRLTFGTLPAASVLAVRSPTGTTFNDRAWHYAAASLGGAGAKLYVDGWLVNSDATVTTAGSYAGYWRWGGDTMTSAWPNRPTNDNFVGSLDEVAIYHSQLSDQQIAWHYFANH